jgi:(2Fe-2S) ferredoxin
MTELYYAHHIFLCTNRRPPDNKYGCCASKGSEALRDYAKKRVGELKIPSTRINAAGCLGRCGEGPVMVIYPEGVWYSPKTEADIDEILTSHLQQGQIVERLRLPNKPTGAA